MTLHPHLILPAGAQVVTLIEQRISHSESVNNIIKSPITSLL
jgi:hypothetical protein